MENLDFGCGDGRNFDHLGMVMLKFWPRSWAKIFDHMSMTMTPGRRPNGPKIAVALPLPPPPPNLQEFNNFNKQKKPSFHIYSCIRINLI